MATLTNPYQTLGLHGFIEIVLDTRTGQKSLRTTRVIEPGDVISFFTADEILAHPTYLTVQVAEDVHITLVPEFLQYINHSCSPNVFFDTEKMQLICIKQIVAAEELRFFYPSTEWEMTQQFLCNCGTKNCLQFIRGAAYLDGDTLKNYRLTSFIQQQLLTRNSS